MIRTSKLFLVRKASFLQYALLNPNFLLSKPNSSTSSSPTTQVKGGDGDNVASPNLAPNELTKINLLLPRLCESNHLHEAIRLIDTVLLTNPPLQSLSLSVLIDRLSAEPTMTQAMSLLNRLKHNPKSHPSHLLQINRMLLISYLKKRRCKEAIKVFNWISRSDSPCSPDAAIYRILVKGLCRNEMTLEALKVVKLMVKELKEREMEVDGDVRSWVCKSLLREARVREFQELNEAFFNLGADGGLDGVVRVVDEIISNWTE